MVYNVTRQCLYNDNLEALLTVGNDYEIEVIGDKCKVSEDDTGEALYVSVDYFKGGI